MMGALTLYNITPGPAMFTEQPDIVWGSSPRCLSPT